MNQPCFSLYFISDIYLVFYKEFIDYQEQLPVEPEDFHWPHEALKEKTISIHLEYGPAPKSIFTESVKGSVDIQRTHSGTPAASCMKHYLEPVRSCVLQWVFLRIY